MFLSIIIVLVSYHAVLDLCMILLNSARPVNLWCNEDDKYDYWLM